MQKKRCEIIKPNNGSQDLVGSSHISPQTDEPCRHSCWSAGMGPLQRPPSHEEYVTHLTAFPVSHHMLPALTPVSSFLSVQARKKGSLGNRSGLTQAVVYYCWFCQRALEAVNTRNNGPWKENTNGKMDLFGQKYQSSHLGNMEGWLSLVKPARLPLHSLHPCLG